MTNLRTMTLVRRTERREPTLVLYRTPTRHVTPQVVTNGVVALRADMLPLVRITRVRQVL